MSRRGWSLSRAQRTQNRIEHGSQSLRQVFSEKAQHAVNILLQQLVLAPIAAVRDRIREMLSTVDLNDEPRIYLQQKPRTHSLAQAGGRGSGGEKSQVIPTSGRI
jgi:hypothetical protein